MKLAFAIVFVFLQMPAGYAVTGPKADVKYWRKVRSADIDFLGKYGWEARFRTCATNISNAGQRLNDEVHVIAAGRGVYSYMFGQRSLKGAALADFMLLNMIEWDTRNRPYFRSLVSIEGQRMFKSNEISGDIKDASRQSPRQLVNSEQAYGLTGALALYHANRDVMLKNQIDLLYQAWHERFYDPFRGGFTDTFDLDDNFFGDTKSFQSMMYPLHAFMFSLREAESNSEAKDRLQDTMTNTADLFINHFYDPITGRIIEKLDANWQPLQNERPFQIAGHGFLAAWTLLRMVHKGFSYKYSHKFQQTALHIIKSLFADGLVDTLRGGVYDARFLDGNREMKYSGKWWWQQGYAILALTLAEKMGLITYEDRVDEISLLKARDQIVKFYDEHFIDHAAGGVFAQVSDDGKVVLSTNKGDAGNWGFHHTELAQMMMFYLKPTSDEVANNRYPAEAIAGGSHEQTTAEARIAKALRGREYGPTLPPVP